MDVHDNVPVRSAHAHKTRERADVWGWSPIGVSLQECKRLVSRNPGISVLPVAHVVSSRLVVGLVGLSASGDELVVGSAVVVVCVGERVEPRRGRGRGADGERFVVRVSVWVNCVLDTDHVELAGVSAVIVVERVGFGVDDARGRVASVGGGLALSTDLSAVVVDGMVYTDGRERDGSGVGLGAVLRVVCVDESGARVGVGSVEGLVLAHECDLVSWFDECAADEDVVAGVVGDLRFWEGWWVG